MYEITQRKQAQEARALGELEPAQPTEMPELAREHARLASTVDGLSNLVSRLCVTLQPVTKQVPTTGNAATPKEPDCHSPLGQAMAGATAGVRRECERLHDLLNALAV